MKKLTIAVLFGGTGSEHEVSRVSAAWVLRNISKEKYDVRKVGITKSGKWIETPAGPKAIEDGSWINRINNRDVYISPDRTFKGMRTIRGKELKVDCVFPVIHGKDGEDGAVQGLLDLSGIPYVGSGILASVASYDKSAAKAIVDRTGIRHATYYVTDRYSFASSPQEEIKSIEDAVGPYPYFVKPAASGSSVGVSKVHGQMELFEAIKLAAEECHKIVIEETIVGRELEVAVLGNRHPHPSPIGEIIPDDEFYTYDDKYVGVGSKAEVATNISKEKELEIQSAALDIYKVLGCMGLARVDFFMTKEQEVYFNEINTMPGFTNLSMYSKLWEAVGIDHEELMDRLIELALEER